METRINNRKKKSFGRCIRMILGAMIVICNTEAQNVGISATGVVPDNSAGLDVNFTDKGVLIPRVNLQNEVDVTTIPSPANSLVVYNTNAGMTNGNGVGFYYWNGSKWVYLPAPGNSPGSAGQVLTSQGPNTPPQWSTLSVSGGGGPTGCANCVSEISPASSTIMTWIQCADYCRSGTWGGYNDWRMPTFDECIMYRTNKAIAPNGSWTYIWTSTPWDARVGGTPSAGYWVVFTETSGGWHNYYYYSNSNCRCVR